MFIGIFRSEGKRASLKRWHKWACDHDDDRGMSLSFWSSKVTSFDRARMKGVKFTAKRLEDLKKSRDSIVMIPDDSAPTGRQFGHVSRFLKTTYPGSNRELLVVQGSWFKQAPVTVPSINPAIQCPVISKDFEPERKGVFWPLAAVFPVSIGLLPFVHPVTGEGNDNLWQVIGNHPDFFKDV